MNRIIVACVVLAAIAGAEPPSYRTTFYQRQEVEALPPKEGYPSAGAPSGKLLLLPGEYLVKVEPNSPFQQYTEPAPVPAVAPLQPVAQIQYQPILGQLQQSPQQQYTYSEYTSGQYPQPTQTFGQLKSEGQQSFGQQTQQSQSRFGQLKTVPQNEFKSEAFGQQSQLAQPRFGQLKAAPQKSQFSEQQQNGVFVPQANNPDAEVFNPQEFVPANLNQNTAQRSNRKFTSSKREETEESVAKYQQASGKLQTSVSGKLTAAKKQNTNVNGNNPNEAAIQQQFNNENLYDEDASADLVAKFQQEPTQFAPQPQQKYPIFFVNQQYFQQPEVSGQYAQVSSTEQKSETKVESTTAAEEESSTEVAKADYNTDGSNSDSENVDNLQEGLYYLLLPDGKLQKIVYMTKEDLKKMQVFANIQYQNVDPISGPIYTFNPANSPFVKVL